MLVKLFTFLFVYILTILNFLVILSPLSFAFVFNLIHQETPLNNVLQPIILLSVAFITVIMLFLMLLNYLFSFSVNRYTANCKKYHTTKEFLIFDNIFKELKSKFNNQKVELYISPSKEVNAYAIGSFRKNAIVITEGIINSFLKQTAGDQEAFLRAMKGVIGHEMSHLINKDYLAATLLHMNEKATRFVSKIIYLFFNLVIKALSFIPLIGGILGNIVMFIYKILDGLINFFYKKIILKIYNFMQLQFSKSIEYRCDRQSAQACGDGCMDLGLSLLGESSFFTVFSTHPRTSTRIKKVKDIAQKKGIIKKIFGVSLTSFLSIILIISAAYFSLQLADLDALVSEYNNLVELILKIQTDLKAIITKIKTLINYK